MKYKVGDIVKIRSDLKAGEEYRGWYVTEAMEALAGKNVTIFNYYANHYYVKGSPWIWIDEMFEGKVEPEGQGEKEYKYNYKKGTKFRRTMFKNEGFEIGEIYTLDEDVKTNQAIIAKFEGGMYGTMSFFEEVKEEVKETLGITHEEFNEALLRGLSVDSIFTDECVKIDIERRCEEWQKIIQRK